MPSRYYSATAQDTTLTSAITSGSTSIVVGSTTGFPSSYPFILALDYNASAEELVAVTAVSGLTLTVTRAFNGTTAVAHSTGAVVRHVITAQDLTDAQTHYDKALSAGAHGVTGAMATFLGTPSSANLLATISDETGTGSLVFGTSPTIATPTLTGTVTASGATIASPTISSPSISSPTITGTINAGGTTGPAGQFLSSTGTGVAWAAPATTSLNLTFNAQTGTTYTLASGDVNALVTANNASAITVTIPPSVFSAGNQIHLQQIGAGQVTFAAGSGVTITSTGATAAAPKIRVQYAAATVICTASNTFTVLGDIA